MKTVTLRNIPPKLEQIIQDRGRVRRTSLNKAVIDLLEEHLGGAVTPPTSEHLDLDNLAGIWSVAEANSFEKALAKQRTIDKDLWK